MFYDYLANLCSEMGISVSYLLESIGVNKSAASKWKAKGYRPSKPIAKKIADYFGITVQELMTGEIEKAPAEAEADEMSELLEEVRRREDLRVLFSLSQKATPDDVRKMIDIIRVIRGEKDGESDY